MGVVARSHEGVLEQVSEEHNVAIVIELFK